MLILFNPKWPKNWRLNTRLHNDPKFLEMRRAADRLPMDSKEWKEAAEEIRAYIQKHYEYLVVKE